MEASILTTLAYADLFDFPLTKEEIWWWLIWEDRGQKTEDRRKFTHLLQFALNSHKVRKTGGFYHLDGREKIVVLRKKRERYSQEKIRRAGKVAEILRRIPWIKLIGLTGGLAQKNAKKEDDIDLFFVTTPNRLWLTRGLVVLILCFLGLYRRPNKIKNMVCPNMLVAEDALKMTPEDLFTAHEVCLMKPLFVRDNTYQKFLRANGWVEKFLPNIYRRLTQSKNTKQGGKISENQRLDQLISVLERLAKAAQLWYMRKRRTKEIVTDSLIKFHPKDLRLKILQEFENRLRKFKI